MRLPERFEQEMRSVLGQEDFASYLSALALPAVRALRVNTAKAKPEEFARRLPFALTPHPYVANGFLYEEDTAQPARHPFYYAGLYYLQEPSAMTPASRLPVPEGGRVLDLCAAPGGKATELAARLAGRGMLLANDLSATRAKALLRNLERQGAENILVTCEEPERLTRVYEGFFDSILLDAPCSGEGMFRREPAMLRAWEERGPEYYVPIQRRLLAQAARLLTPGGYLLYSTCTFSPLENEDNIAWILRQEPSLSLCRILPRAEGFAPGISRGKTDLSECVRIYPHRMTGEGHFLALLRREDGPGGGKEPAKTLRGDRRPPEEAKPFLSLVQRDWSEGSFYTRDDQVYYLSDALRAAEGLRYLRTGLHLGTVRKGRFVPSQAAAMALSRDTYGPCVSLPADGEAVIRYLKGETLSGLTPPAERSGDWQLVLADEFPLGFARWAGTNLKNKYSAGWRMV